MATPITRVTMIKIPIEEHISIALQGFEEFAKTQQKDGLPYILSMRAGPAEGSARELGYTVVAQSVFKKKSDMEYYETSCEGHQKYKDFLKTNVVLEGLLAVYFTPSHSFEFLEGA